MKFNKNIKYTLITFSLISVFTACEKQPKEPDEFYIATDSITVTEYYATDELIRDSDARKRVFEVNSEGYVIRERFKDIQNSEVFIEYKYIENTPFVREIQYKDIEGKVYSPFYYQYILNSEGAPTECYYTGKDSNPRKTWKYTYNDKGQLISRYHEFTNFKKEYNTYAYNNMGRLEHKKDSIITYGTYATYTSILDANLEYWSDGKLIRINVKIRYEEEDSLTITYYYYNKDQLSRIHTEGPGGLSGTDYIEYDDFNRVTHYISELSNFADYTVEYSSHFAIQPSILSAEVFKPSSVDLPPFSPYFEGYAVDHVYSLFSWEGFYDTK